MPAPGSAKFNVTKVWLFLKKGLEFFVTLKFYNSSMFQADIPQFATYNLLKVF